MNRQIRFDGEENWDEDTSSLSLEALHSLRSLYITPGSWVDRSE